MPSPAQEHPEQHHCGATPGLMRAQKSVEGVIGGDDDDDDDGGDDVMMMVKKKEMMMMSLMMEISIAGMGMVLRRTTQMISMTNRYRKLECHDKRISQS
eukprot:3941520-Rhodomonas_salina.2